MINNFNRKNFSNLINDFNKKKIKIISLGLGEPTFETPREIINNTIKALNQGKTKYSTPSGLLGLKKEILKKVNKNKLKFNEKNIFITNGAKQAMYFSLLSLLEKGDEVIIFYPAYISYEKQIELISNKIIIKKINLNKKNFTFKKESLESLINKKTKAIIINSPNNPSGKIFSLNELKLINEVVKKRNIYIISDEVYDENIFFSKKFYSFNHFNESNKNLIIINGFSKSHSMTGWRIGYACVPDNQITKMNNICLHINTNINTFVQNGLFSVNSKKNNNLLKFNQELESKITFTSKIFETSNKINIYKPMGGLFIFLDISKTRMKSEEFVYKLLKKYKIATISGITFGKKWDSFIRISLVSKNSEFKRGIILLSKFINENSK